jgi:hypothetical protein
VPGVSDLPPDTERCAKAHIHIMKAKTKSRPDQEPVGIVISRGTRLEQSPMVVAYVWGPAPEISEDPLESKVA